MDDSEKDRTYVVCVYHAVRLVGTKFKDTKKKKKSTVKNKFVFTKSLKVKMLAADQGT